MTQTSIAPTQRPKIRTVDVVANKVAGVTLRALPHIPDRIKRLLMGGRSITLDGKTLSQAIELRPDPDFGKDRNSHPLRRN